MRLLCRIGFHRWGHWYRFRQLGGTQMVRRVCLSCPTIDTRGVYDA